MRQSSSKDVIVEYSNFFVVRSFIPEPWQGEPIAYNLRIQSEYVDDPLNINVSIYRSANPKTISTYAIVSSGALVEWQSHPADASPLFVIRFNSLIPFTNYTLWFSPITSAGPALVEGGPFRVRTLQSAANQPPAPIICDCFHNEVGFATVLINAPVPPYGIIVRYDIGVPNAVDVLKFDILHTITDVSSLNVTIPVTGVDVTSIRVRAYTSVGPGPWSDRAVDQRATYMAPLEDQSEALAIGLGVVIPIVVLLVIVVMWLVRRQRETEKHPAFPFPPPDNWEIDRSLIEFNELLGLLLHPLLLLLVILYNLLCRHRGVWQGVAR
jgi:hypothetical protein